MTKQYERKMAPYDLITKVEVLPSSLRITGHVKTPQYGDLRPKSTRFCMVNYSKRPRKDCSFDWSEWSRNCDINVLFMFDLHRSIKKKSVLFLSPQLFKLKDLFKMVFETLRIKMERGQWFDGYVDTTRLGQKKSGWKLDWTEINSVCFD